MEQQIQQNEEKILQEYKAALDFAWKFTQTKKKEFDCFDVQKKITPDW